MELLFFFALAGAIIVVLILKFEKKQTVKVNTVLKQTRAVPPLLMLKSTEQKIGVLKAALRYDDIPQNMASAASGEGVNNNPNEKLRQSKVQELKVIAAKYNNGQISLEAYNVKLDDLLSKYKAMRSYLS